MNYEILDDIKPKEFVELRKSVEWKEINLEQSIIALNNTMIKVSIVVDKKVVAMGRLVGDYSCKGVLSDIIVNPEYQHKGLGKVIVTTILGKVINNLKEGERFQIETTPTSGNRDFYINCGFKYKPENQDGVYIWIEK